MNSLKLIKPDKVKHDWDVINFRLDTKLANEFDAKLETLGISRSEALRQLVELFLKSE